MRTDHRLTVFTASDGRQVTTRSALEARWAIFFSGLCLRWQYEPSMIVGYTPDFLVEGLGYVEIKPTLDLLISESSHKIKRAALSYSGDKFFAFVGNKVGFDTCALYLGNRIFAPTWRQMVEFFNAVTDSLVADHVGLAIHRANAAKLDHFVSVGKTMQLDCERIIAEPVHKLRQQFNPNQP